MHDFGQPFRDEQIRIAREKVRLENPVVPVFESLKSYCKEFERSLDNDHEAAIMLTSFGGIIVFHAQQIGFSAPNIITFYGVTSEGERVQLIQHVSQLNFLLKAAKKIEEKPYRIGFINEK